MIKQRTIQLLTLISSATLLTACATNEELFAKYDKTCDLPNSVKVVEKIVEVEKIKTVEKTANPVVEGLHWEPAVYFGFDQDGLEAPEIARLEKDAKILKDYPDLKVNIQSFTDIKGSHQYNKNLALRRQATIVNYFREMGIDSERIILSPLGEELQILGSSTDDRTINRRVELMLLDNKGRPVALKIRPQATGFTAPFPVK